MSIESEINRINNNVTDALAATAEKGATVPEDANSDDLGTLIRSIPTGGKSLPPMRISLSGTQTSVSWGLFAEKYTAAELYEIAATRDIVVETKGLVNSQYLYGYYRYSRGTETVVDFDGWYETPANRCVPASMQINASANITVIKRMFAEGTLPTDTTLNVSGGAADSKTVGTKFKEISEQIANIGSGGGSINVTAEVGQTIVVKEVDADGKPTAWESADYQPRTHWSEFGTVTIMPETTVEIDPDNGAGYVFVDFVLETGKAYTIKYNGVEYPDCTGMQVDMGLAFGNLGAEDESFPVTEHPFILISPEEDVDGDGVVDYAVIVIPLDGSESVTLSIEGEEEIAHKIPKKYVPTLEEMRTETVEILPETTIPIDPDEGAGELPVNFALEPNKPYTIKYNGVEYSDCTGMELEEGVVYFGNLSALDESFPATEHPFILGSAAMDMDGDGNIDYTIAVFPLDGSETVTLSIIGGELVHKLDGKYMPDNVPHIESHGDVILSDYVMTNDGGINEPMGIVTVGANYEVRIGSQTFQCTAKEPSMSADTMYAEISDDDTHVNILIARPELTLIAGVYGIIGNGRIEGETLSISAAYTAHKIDERCLPPSFVLIPVQRSGNSIDGYTYISDYTYEGVENLISRGYVPALCVSDFSNALEMYYMRIRVAGKIEFVSMDTMLYWSPDGLKDTM